MDHLDLITLAHAQQQRRVLAAERDETGDARLQGLQPIRPKAVVAERPADIVDPVRAAAAPTNRRENNTTTKCLTSTVLIWSPFPTNDSMGHTKDRPCWALVLLLRRQDGSSKFGRPRANPPRRALAFPSIRLAPSLTGQPMSHRERPNHAKKDQEIIHRLPRFSQIKPVGCALHTSTPCSVVQVTGRIERRVGGQQIYSTARGA